VWQARSLQGWLPHFCFERGIFFEIALLLTVFGYEIVRDFALFHYPPLIKLKVVKSLQTAKPPHVL
jgi:hypothetical protein